MFQLWLRCSSHTSLLCMVEYTALLQSIVTSYLLGVASNRLDVGLLLAATSIAMIWSVYRSDEAKCSLAKIRKLLVVLVSPLAESWALKLNPWKMVRIRLSIRCIEILLKKYRKHSRNCTDRSHFWQIIDRILSWIIFVISSYLTCNFSMRIHNR